MRAGRSRPATRQLLTHSVRDWKAARSNSREARGDNRDGRRRHARHAPRLADRQRTNRREPLDDFARQPRNAPVLELTGESVDLSCSASAPVGHRRASGSRDTSVRPRASRCRRPRRRRPSRSRIRTALNAATVTAGRLKRLLRRDRRRRRARRASRAPSPGCARGARGGLEPLPACVINEAHLAASGRQPQIRVVDAQQQPMLRARREHPVRLQAPARHEIVDENADVGLVAAEARSRRSPAPTAPR